MFPFSSSVILPGGQRLIQPTTLSSLSRVRLCHSMGCSTPGLPVLHRLLEFAQIHVHRVGDASWSFLPRWRHVGFLPCWSHAPQGPGPQNPVVTPNEESRQERSTARHRAQKGFMPDRADQRGEARPPRQRVTAGGSHVCLGPRPTDAAHRGQGRPVRHEGNASSLLGPRELRQTCRDTGRGTGPGHLLR